MTYVKLFVYVKPKCPLCKQQLALFLHRLKANLEHEAYIIPKPEPAQPEDEILPGLTHLSKLILAERGKLESYTVNQRIK